MGLFEQCLLKRYTIEVAYIKSKGWDFDNLTLEQISEIRSQQNWKDAGMFNQLNKANG